MERQTCHITFTIPPVSSLNSGSFRLPTYAPRHAAWFLLHRLTPVGRVSQRDYSVFDHTVMLCLAFLFPGFFLVFIKL